MGRVRRIAAAVGLAAATVAVPVAVSTVAARPTGCVASKYVTVRQTASTCSSGTGQFWAQEFCVLSGGAVAFWITGGTGTAPRGLSFTGPCWGTVTARRTMVSG